MSLNYLFRQNLILRAKSAYTGNWITASDIFDIYSYLMDIRNKELEYKLDPENQNYAQKYSLIHLLQRWIGTYREHNKHMSIDLDLVDKITLTLKTVSNYYDKKYNNYFIQPLLAMYKLGKYKELLQDLITYMTKFFKELGIDVKTVKIKSQYTDLNILAFTPNLSPSEDYVSTQLNINTTIKNKIFNKYKEDYAKKGLSLVENNSEYYTLYDQNESIYGYIIAGQWDNIITDKSQLDESIRKNTLINDNYNKLSYSNGALYTPKGTLVKELEHLSPKTLNNEITKYNTAIQTHNQSLKPYEPKLSNDPKIIQLGEHTLKVVKVFYRNITRPVIIEGPYIGLFLDQMVSSTGKVIGSQVEVSPYFTENTQILQSLGDTKKNIKVKDTLDIEQSHNIVTKRVQDYQSKSNNIDEITLHYVTSETEGNVEFIPISYDEIKVPRKIKPKFDKLTGLCFLTDIFKNEDITYGIRSTENHEIRLTAEMIYDQWLDTKITFTEDGKPNTIENLYAKLDACIPEGFATRLMTQQIKTASELGFEKKILMAAKSNKGSSRDYVGYYVWPKLGYDINIELWDWTKYVLKEILEKRNIPKKQKTLKYIEDNFLNLVAEYLPELLLIQKWFSDIQGIDVLAPNTIISLIDLYACKVDGKFIGQKFWKDYGGQVDLEFDLTPGSLSMRIMGRYVELKSKAEGIPVEDYLNIDYNKYARRNNNLECLLKVYLDTKLEDTGTKYNLNKAISIAINNHENGSINLLLNNPQLITKLWTERVIDDDTLKNLRTLARINKLDSYNKFASSYKPDNIDPFLREIDMDILDQVWDEVNAMYESGKI